jgi:hypothetical protein
VSYEKDKKAFKEKYGEDAIPNSVKVVHATLFKVRNQRRWELLLSTQGKLMPFTKNVAKMDAYSIQEGFVPQFHNIVSIEVLKSLKKQIDNILKLIQNSIR